MKICVEEGHGSACNEDWALRLDHSQGDEF